MRILIPTDCTDLAAIALKPTMLLSEKFDVEIVALKVINAPVDALYNKDGEMIENEEFDISSYKKELEQGNQLVQDWAEQNGCKVQPIVRTGLMIESILKVIDDEQIDLVVMHSDITSGLKKMVHGPIVERIVLNSKVPVLTVKDYFDSFKNIAFANNFRRYDVRIGMVKKIQEAFGSKLHLVRVNTPRKFMSNDDAIFAMKAFTKAHNLENVEYHHINNKKIDSALIDFCKIYKIDLMTIGSKQRKGLLSVMRGCPSKEIVNQMEFPVLTFRSKSNKKYTYGIN
jgi:nucleotide-binding universal stress UspA family protein